MRRKSAHFGVRHNETKPFTTHAHDAGFLGIAASRVVTYSAGSEILVELELHAAPRRVGSTIRSRVISAAYATHARTASSTSCGYCSRMSEAESLSANRSR